MARQSARKTQRSTAPFLQRSSPSLREVLRSCNQRAHDQANRRTGHRESRSIHAAIAETCYEDGLVAAHWFQRIYRFLLGLLLLPFCWVTSWTLLSRFSHATLAQGFWLAPSFWYFAVGVLFMLGWFWSGLAKSFFLYLYVLGHELTHAVFVILCRGRVTSMHVSTAGGYITTNKTNLIIALSPYFVPFWSVVITALFAIARYGFDVGGGWNLVYYALLGISWTFHFVWTVWMIPRDQPDLRQNGTFLSLCVIYLANLLVMASLLCMAQGSPLESAAEFGREWVKHAATSADHTWQWAEHYISHFMNRLLLPQNGN
jgi:hypothetical protein